MGERSLGVGVFLFFLIIVPARGAPLGLRLLDHPEVESGSIMVTYDAASTRFSASGGALSITFDGTTSTDLIAGTFEIEALIDESGDMSTGKVSIAGQVAGAGGEATGVLLDGQLSEFGFTDADSADVFEFVFRVSGGALATTEVFGRPGAVVGVILASGPGSGFTGSFSEDFGNLGQGTSRAAPIPEAGSLGLLAAGAMLLRTRRPAR